MKTQTKKPSNARAVKTPTQVANKLDESTRLHRSINWVVSLLLMLFALWSINLNAEGRSMLKQSLSVVDDINAQIVEVNNNLKVVKELCQTTTVVLPTATTGNEVVQ